MASREAQLQLLSDDIARATPPRRSCRSSARRSSDLEGRLTNLRAVLPEEKDAADLLRRMQTVAMQSNLRIKGFKPGHRHQAAARRVADSLELDGTYHNLAIFFDRVNFPTRSKNSARLWYVPSSSRLIGHSACSCLVTSAPA